MQNVSGQDVVGFTGVLTVVFDVAFFIPARCKVDPVNRIDVVVYLFCDRVLLVIDVIEFDDKLEVVLYPAVDRIDRGIVGDVEKAV